MYCIMPQPLDLLQKKCIIKYGRTKTKADSKFTPAHSAGFFVMAYFEALSAKYPLQRHEAARPEAPLMLAKPDMVIYPGTSSRRMAFFDHAFPGTPVVQLPIGEEPVGDIGEVARFKLNEASLQFNHEGFGQCVAVVAADQNNVTPAMTENGPVMISRLKPRNPREVLGTFSQIVEFSDATNQKPFYVGDSASAMLHLNGSAHLVEDRQQSTVELNDRFRLLATPEGFAHYERALTEFYSQPPYSTSHMEVGMENLSAGISLPVLVKMGMVDSVDGVLHDDPRFRQQLLLAVHNVAVGVSPRLLKPVQVDERKVLEQWNWLNGVVDSALS